MIKDCLTGLLSYVRLNETYVVLDKHLHFEFKPSDFPFWLLGLFRSVVKLEGKWVMDDIFFITVPKGFVCDLASIPKFLQWLFKPDGPWAKAAAFHDLLYNLSAKKCDNALFTTGARRHNHMEHKLHSRSACDAIFYLAMRRSGVNPLIAFLFYLGVRVGGSKHFRTGKKIPVGDILARIYPNNGYSYLHRKEWLAVFSSKPMHIEEETNEKTDWTLIVYPNLPTPIIAR